MYILALSRVIAHPQQLRPDPHTRTRPQGVPSTCPNPPQRSLVAEGGRVSSDACVIDGDDGVMIVV